MEKEINAQVTDLEVRGTVSDRLEAKCKKCGIFIGEVCTQPSTMMPICLKNEINLVSDALGLVGGLKRVAKKGSIKKYKSVMEMRSRVRSLMGKEIPLETWPSDLVPHDIDVVLSIIHGLRPLDDGSVNGVMTAEHMTTWLRDYLKSLDAQDCSGDYSLENVQVVFKGGKQADPEADNLMARLRLKVVAAYTQHEDVLREFLRFLGSYDKASLLKDGDPVAAFLESKQSKP